MTKLFLIVCLLSCPAIDCGTWPKPFFDFLNEAKEIDINHLTYTIAITYPNN